MTKSSVIKYFKSTTATARFLNISQAAVSKWPEIIPEKQAMRLDRLTNGALEYNESLYEKAA